MLIVGEIEERFSARGIPMPPNNARQALIPTGAMMVTNPLGTAPGFICPVAHPAGERHIVTLPGVPSEMRRMAQETVLPWVRERAGTRRFASRIFSTYGLSESRLDELLSGVVTSDEARLSFRAAFPRMQTRLTVSGEVGDDLEARLDGLEGRVRERLGTAVYAVGDVGLEEVVVRELTERRLTIAVAESCTGGLIGHRLTDVPGSSAVFRLGVVAYANEAKISQLGVRPATLEANGAVSPEVAEEMAEGVRRAGGAAVGVATTGIAGPGGGTEEKPVGTVWLGYADERGPYAVRLQFVDDRLLNKRLSVTAALALLRRQLRRRDRLSAEPAMS